jgi:hypothetical protein
MAEIKDKIENVHFEHVFSFGDTYRIRNRKVLYNEVKIEFVCGDLETKEKIGSEIKALLEKYK